MPQTFPVQNWSQRHENYDIIRFCNGHVKNKDEMRSISPDQIIFLLLSRVVLFLFSFSIKFKAFFLCLDVKKWS